MKKAIPFSPPDITEDEINAVVEVLKSGWITSGQKVKDFENNLSIYTNTKKVNALSSATSAMEIALRMFGIGAGDEVITTSYTYAATANVIYHTGAKVIFVDINDKTKNDFNISIENIEKAITNKTKAIIAVDIAGLPNYYEEIKEILKAKSNIFKPSSNKYQQELKRPLFLLDAAHSIGAKYKNEIVGSQADVTAFSFHAVKNITTAEGGCLLYNDIGSITADTIYKEVSQWALHGQSKSAFDKTTGGWQYSIDFPGYKYNLSDIHAAIGLSQLKRYDEMLDKRKKIVSIYNEVLASSDKCILPTFKDDLRESSYHLYLLRIKGYKEEQRNNFIDKLKEDGITLNVHYLPVVAHKAYVDLGYKIENHKNSFSMYEQEVTLPLYSTLSEDDAYFIAQKVMDKI